MVAHLVVDELERIFSVEEFEDIARQRMPIEGYSFVAGWAGSGGAARANREAYHPLGIPSTGARRRQPHRHLDDGAGAHDRPADHVRADRAPPVRPPRRRAGDRSRRRGARHDHDREHGFEPADRGDRAGRHVALVPALLVHRPGDHRGAGRAGGSSGLRRHLRDGRHPGPGLARRRDAPAAAPVTRDPIRQPAGGQRSPARGRRQPHVEVARMAALDHEAADPRSRGS